MAYIAMYSPRPGALSHRWFDDISLQIKKQRHHQLTEDLKVHSRAYNKSLIGKTYRVLVRGKARHEGYMMALNEGKINVRFLSNDESLIGQFVDIKVTSAADFSVEGELVKIISPPLSEKCGL